MKLDKKAVLDSLPPEWPEDLMPAIQSMVRAAGTKIIVLDDDPTGTQTVHDVPVLTGWSRSSLIAVLSEPEAVAYILTNSRSVSLSEARAMNRQIATNLAAARLATGRDFAVISRSDSTLRGHYPGEVEALAEGLGQSFDGTLIVPFFLEGGRLTIHDTHYVAEGDWLVPAAETEFARDATFGYRNSDLCAWVSEKHEGAIAPGDVASVSLADLRLGGPAAVSQALSRMSKGQVCVVNAATYCDMEVFVAGLLHAEAAGRRFLYRTAASFVRVRGGLTPRDPLTAGDLAGAGDRRAASSRPHRGGLIIVGSYVQKSTDQMLAAARLPGVVSLELSTEALLDAHSREEEIGRVSAQVNQSLSAGHDTLVYTGRQLVTGPDRASSLRIGQHLSSAVVAVVRNVSEAPAWVIAKGGITSSDVATEALDVRRAQVLGQALPGIPIWRTGQESRWPDMIYVVFPGNVGGPDALAEMIQILRASEPPRVEME